ncbi:hypothetical protein ACWIB8_07030 [Corynebacterium flavescens]
MLKLFSSRYLPAELLSARGTALQWLPLFALPLVAITFNFSRFSVSNGDATALLYWQALYLTGMAAPLIAVIAASAEAREKAANYGGTAWLPVDAKAQHVARLLVVLLSIAAFHVLNFGGSWLASTLAGLTGSGRILWLGFLAFLGSIGIAGLASALARATNLITTLVVFVIWQFIGIQPSVVEGGAWQLWPMAWPVRLILPVASIHQNAVPLEPGSALAAESPWVALLLCLALAVVGVATAILVPDGRRPHPLFRFLRGRATRQTDDTATSGFALERTAPAAPALRGAAPRTLRLLGAFSRIVLTPALISCLVLSVLALAITGVLYPINYVHGLFVFLILPVGCGLLPVLSWPSMRSAWPLMLTENPHCPRALLGWSALCISGLSLLAFAIGVTDGGALGGELRRLLLSITVGCALFLLSLLLVLRLGSPAALVLTIILTIISVTIGGDVLADSALWIFAPSAWPQVADTTPRLVVAFGLSSAASLAMTWASLRVLGRTLD